jgi:hypothetical protein
VSQHRPDESAAADHLAPLARSLVVVAVFPTAVPVALDVEQKLRAEAGIIHRLEALGPRLYLTDIDRGRADNPLAGRTAPPPMPLAGQRGEPAFRPRAQQA